MSNSEDTLLCYRLRRRGKNDMDALLAADKIESLQSQLECLNQQVLEGMSTMDYLAWSYGRSK